jgi:hypothetical protein
MAYWNGTHWVPEGPPQLPPRHSHRLWGAVAEASLVTLLIFGLIAATTLAAPGAHGGKPASGQAGSCSITPDPVAVGADYTIWGSELPADAIVNVEVSDSHGTALFIMGTDAYGNVSVTWHPYWAGTSTVSVSYKPRNKTVQLATCQFQVST